jgi:xylulokinase
VVPGRWLTFYILNTGGEALEWFRSTMCREIDAATFYEGYLPEVLEAFFADPDIEARERELPVYDPHLGGSRYSLERLKGGFDGLTLQTTRDDLLLSLVRGNMSYLGNHLRSVAGLLPLGTKVGISGGGAKIRGMLDARRRWTGDFQYEYQDQSSMVGAAMLGQIYQAGGVPDGLPAPAAP